MENFCTNVRPADYLPTQTLWAIQCVRLKGFIYGRMIHLHVVNMRANYFVVLWFVLWFIAG